MKSLVLALCLLAPFVSQAQQNEVILNCEVTGNMSGLGVNILYQNQDQQWLRLDVFSSVKEAKAYIQEMKKQGHCQTYSFSEESK